MAIKRPGKKFLKIISSLSIWYRCWTTIFWLFVLAWLEIKSDTIGNRMTDRLTKTYIIQWGMSRCKLNKIFRVNISKWKNLTIKSFINLNCIMVKCNYLFDVKRKVTLITSCGADSKNASRRFALPTSLWISSTSYKLSSSVH